MRLILEGPDNAGKTTLARKLQDALGDGIRYFHPGGKPASFQDELDCVTLQLAELDQHENVVLDRITPISQRVYNPDPDMDKVRAHTMSWYAQRDVIIVYCRPSTDRLMRVEDLTWRDGESEEHKQKIIRGQHTFIERYDSLMEKTPHVVYNFEEAEAADLVFTQAVKAMNGSKAAESWFRAMICLSNGAQS